MPARNPPEPPAPVAAATATTAPELPIPPQLLQHLRERRLLLFAGAGLSAQAGLPTWRSLVQDVVDATIAETMQGEESRRELESMIAAGKWLQIADHCKLKLGPGEYARLLGERLSDSGRPVPEAHRLAVRLPFAAWVTTNYDKLLERAYAEERGGLPKTLTSLDTEALGRLLFDGAPFVLKAHGDLDKPDSLVFTSRDYRDLIHGNAAFSAVFSSILLTHSVLFVGYSLADPDFNLLLDRQLLTFRGFAPERYALMSGIGKVEEEYLWRVCQIRVIAYPEGQHEAVPAFFQSLADRLAAAPAATVSSVARVASVAVATPARRATRAAPAPAAVATPAVLALDWREGAVQAMLSDGGKLVATASGPREAWAAPAAASRALESGSDREGSLAECSGALGRTLGPVMVKALANALQGRRSRPLRLDLTREVERLPWELLAAGSRTLAELAAVYRAPVGVSESARGLPAVASPLRALVVADTKSAEPALALPGAAAEGRAVADEIRANGVGEVRLLLGQDATHDALARAFDDFAPDVFHFAGHAWFDEHEAYLELADRHLTASMMRPWLTRHSPAFMFLNSHYTAFIPAGVEGQGGAHAATVSAGLRGRPGFADLAMRSGVGAFLGTYSGAIDDSGARDFALALFRGLLQGHSVAGALQAARALAREQQSATALLYCLYGEGALRLVDAGGGG
ncbi:MAG: SIR2 family protein [Accumulibacter sp.]|jgi:hypothetical protein|uniref:SIR2 family protein n=1 Tax=Accumulibacter sp. TaxID=2053492 RepID=UPI002FC3A215